MFRGLSTVNLDQKGRLAIPARFRDGLQRFERAELVLTVNPWDRSLWLYPVSEWEAIEEKLSALSDFDRNSRRTKQIMRGYATDLSCDGQGRVLLPQELREVAGLDKQVVLLGQGNKLEIWNAKTWQSERDDWLADVGTGSAEPTAALETLSL
ncbi:MAG: division/cell wall cluster transcriptional repressor MraZ [Gammaproteobacteria bacterium]